MKMKLSFILGILLATSISNTFSQSKTENELKVSDLPASVQSSISKYFADFKINEASKIQSVKNGNCFEAEIQKGEEIFDVLFTADGKVLSKTKMEKEKEDKD